MMTVTPDASKPLSGLLVLRLRTTMLTVRRVDRHCPTVTFDDEDSVYAAGHF